MFLVMKATDTGFHDLIQQTYEFMEKVICSGIRTVISRLRQIFFPKPQPRVEPPLLKHNATRTPDWALPPKPVDNRLRFVAVDVETANSSRGSICQIGLAFVSGDNDIVTEGYLVDPEEHFSDFNVNLHGIDEEMVAGAPTFPEVFHYLREVFQDAFLVQHSTFDKQAFDLACHTYGLEPLQNEWINSVTIARKAWPEFKGNGGHGLANLKAELALVFDHHDAEEDAKAAAEVVLLAEERTGKDFLELGRSKSKGASAGRRYEKAISLEGKAGGKLAGEVVCFSGKLTMSRSAAALLAAEAGISVRGSISKKVTLLVVGDHDMTLLAGHDKSSKHRRAEELIKEGHPLRILCETEFMALIQKA